jgi:hypothetical protein
MNRSSCSSVWPPRSIDVSTPPGEMEFTVIPCGARVRASPRVIETIPPLLAA